jgi:hypothetical protein
MEATVAPVARPRIEVGTLEMEETPEAVNEGNRFENNGFTDVTEPFFTTRGRDTPEESKANRVRMLESPESMK